jgi:DNA-binding MarR family transcriptional regulator
MTADPVVTTFVDLLEQAESVNAMLRTPEELRAVGRVVDALEVAVLLQVTRVAGATAGEIARAAALPVAVVNKALRSLQRAGMIESTRGPHGHVHRATDAVATLRDAVRARAARQVSYALSALTVDEQASLDAAAPALAALARALGFRDVHAGFGANQA